MFIPLYLALVRLHLDSPVSATPLQERCRVSGANPEEWQQDDYMTFEERLREMGLFSLERRR